MPDRTTRTLPFWNAVAFYFIAAVGAGVAAFYPCLDGITDMRAIIICSACVALAAGAHFLPSGGDSNGERFQIAADHTYLTGYLYTIACLCGVFYRIAHPGSIAAGAEAVDATTALLGAAGVALATSVVGLAASVLLTTIAHARSPLQGTDPVSQFLQAMTRGKAKVYWDEILGQLSEKIGKVQLDEMDAMIKEIGAKFNDVMSKLDVVLTNFERLQEESATTEDRFGQLSVKVGEVTGLMSTLGSEFTAMREGVAGLREPVSGLAEAFAPLADNVRAAGEGMGRLSNESQPVADGLRLLATTSADTTGEMDGLGRSARTLGDQFDRVHTLAATLDQTTESVTQLEHATTSILDVVQNALPEAGNVGSALERLGDRLEELAGAASSAETSMATTFANVTNQMDKLAEKVELFSDTGLSTLQDVVSMTKQAGERLAEITARVHGEHTKALGMVAAVVERLSSGSDSLAGEFGVLQARLASIIEPVNVVWDQIRSLSERLETMVSIFAKLETASKQADGIAPSLGQLTVALGEQLSVLDRHRQSLHGLSGLVDALTNSLEGMSQVGEQGHSAAQGLAQMANEMNGARLAVGHWAQSLADSGEQLAAPAQVLGDMAKFYDESDRHASALSAVTDQLPRVGEELAALERTVSNWREGLQEHGTVLDEFAGGMTTSRQSIDAFNKSIGDMETATSLFLQAVRDMRLGKGN
jgi:methyl-accepting chemotaxis protein